jgi:DNA-binding LytR/AlgR family response regulator
MNSLIIEDEKIAAERLKELINRYDENIDVLEVLQSVQESVIWFENNPEVDLVFMDIQLADGLSFEIFEKTIVKSPIIFTTAYDEYALKAFKVNSIDYLLKPIDFDELSKAIEKYKLNVKSTPLSSHVFDSVLKQLTNEYKTKFVVKVGEHIKVLKTEQILFFSSMEKATFLHTDTGRDYAVNYSLEQLEELLEPKKFFRISRKYILAFSAIKDIISFSNSRLQIKVNSKEPDDLIVSRERVKAFKAWLED